MVAEREHWITAADGVRLHAQLASPRQARGVLLLCHGLTTDSQEHGAFPRLRDRALRVQLAVARFDFRAHGQSEGSNEGLRLTGLRTDIEAMLRLIEQELGRLPMVPVGLSFAGGPAVHIAARARCAGLVLWYPVVDYEWNYGPASCVPFTQQMRTAVSREEPAWAELTIPGLGYYLPSELVREMASDDTLETLRSLSLPVLAYHGSRDGLVDPQPLRRLAAERDNLRLRMVPGAGHGFRLWRPWVIWGTVAFAGRAIAAAAAGAR